MFKELNHKLLTPDEPSYKTVEELNEVLEEALNKGKIRNVALTGPFGSGKSSILYTLRENYKQFEYLPISLATLKADEEFKQENNKQYTSAKQIKPIEEEGDGKKEEEIKPKYDDVEKLNRRIEYSILQQIIYKETISTLPNSRFKKIVHIEEDKLSTYAWFTIGTILAIIILFFPNLANIQTLLVSIGAGKFIPFLKLCSLAFILHVIHLGVKSFVKSYCNSKLNKLNLKDMHIEVEKENSIFNKYLDEIIYFFQVTKYNVVIIEDLDRFGTPNIFLKLRELNQLINESKAIGRNVVFVYAVKDDLFIDEDRTKFFDYITTVIPVINSSNSKDKLLKELQDRGLKENAISIRDLKEMALYIQDMRILTNIANEFQQYKEKLCSANNQHLSLTKLLAMIVYKNYYPKDFAMLHKREGKVYSCISAKPEFLQYALQEIKTKEKALDEKYLKYLDTRHLNESDLRFMFLSKLKDNIPYKIIFFVIEDRTYTTEDISNNAELFDNLTSRKEVSFYYSRINNTNAHGSSPIHYDKIDQSINFTRKMEALQSSEKEFERKRIQLQKEKLTIYKQKLNTLITNYKLGESKLYKDLGLPEMIDVFIRRGFIDEEYYDYISFFYEGMISCSDRELIQSIKQQIPMGYSYHIDKVENFVEELFPFMFETKVILNNDLMDYVALKHTDYFNLMMYILETDNAPLDFLAQYYQYGKAKKQVFEHFIEWNKLQSWKNIDTWKNESEKELLKAGWIQYCGQLLDETKLWLNNQYSFITSQCTNIGIKRCTYLITQCKFEELNKKNTELLNYVIDNNSYKINSHNLCLITNFLCKRSYITKENINLSRIRETKNKTFIKYVEDNISKAISHFSTTCKNESEDEILFILNHTEIANEIKTAYLKEQQNLLDNDEQITDDQKTLAYKLLLITPTWENVLAYFTNKNKEESVLIEYIEHFAKSLADQSVPEDNDQYKALFKYLLGSNLLDIKTYSSIISSFIYTFNGDFKLRRLDSNRLLLLLSHSMIPFSQENTNIMKKTDVYVDYLLTHHKEFFEDRAASYILNQEIADKIMESDVFTNEQKEELKKIIPNEYPDDLDILDFEDITF